MTEQETTNILDTTPPKSNRLPQLHATVSTELYALVQEMAEKEKRTLSSMASILVERGLKEKIRLKVKNSKQK